MLVLDLLPKEDKNKKEIVIFLQTIVPDYRVPFFDMMRNKIGDGFFVLSGNAHRHPSIVSRSRGKTWDVSVKNRFLIGRKFWWQSGCVSRALKADLVVAEGNPRVFSTLVILLLRKLMGCPSILWAHAFSSHGKSSFYNLYRHAFLRLADVIVCYTETQCRQLRCVIPSRSKDIFYASNAVLTKGQCETISFTGGTGNVVFVGRLVEGKRPLLLIKAFYCALEYLPKDTYLEIVGSGPLQTECEHLVEKLGISDRVIFHGHISVLSRLQNIFSRALFSVSPGYVGLSTIHSLGFGVPMLVADDEPHSPEIEACRIGENAKFFTAKSRPLRGKILIA